MLVIFLSSVCGLLFVSGRWLFPRLYPYLHGNTNHKIHYIDIPPTSVVCLFLTYEKCVVFSNMG